MRIAVILEVCSIVLLITYRNTGFLLTGDVQEEERRIVARWPKVTVLKIAHHGSCNGTDAAFLKATRPKYAVISVGKNNSYGHPDKQMRAFVDHINGDMVTLLI